MAEPGDLESEIDRLYGLPLDDFVKARDELASSLRAADRRPDATTVKGLRKPTVGAWTLNQAVRTRPDDLSELLEAGDALRLAQERLLAGGDRAELREATERERELVSRLAAAATSIAGEAGVGGSLEPRLQATLHAAALDQSTRTELAAGRLVREREPIALGELAVGEAEAESSARRAGAQRKTAEPSRAGRRRARARTEDPDAERAEELADLRDQVSEARERAEAAASELEDAERQVAESRERAQAASGERKDAERAERDARKAVKEAERAERAARKAVQDADASRRDARQAAQQAERAAERLEQKAERLLSADAGSGRRRRRRG
jgi:chromosome segregation ATPase